MKMSFSEALRRAVELTWQFAVFLLPGDRSLDSVCMVLDLDECEDDSDEPEAAKVAGLAYSLGVQELQQILANARLQKSDLSRKEELAAYVYYEENDSFLVLSQPVDMP